MSPQDEQNNSSSQTTAPATPPQAPSANPEQPPVTQQAVVPPAKKRHVKLALLLMIGPSVLLIAAIILGAVSNFAFSNTTPAGDGLYPEDNPARTVINVIIYLAGAVTIITWLPGIIIGIILLNKK